MSLTLPDEFVLLLHKSNGSYYSTANQAAAAQVGELVLRERAALDGKRKLRLLDSSASDIAWMDELLTKLANKAGTKDKPIALSSVMGNQTGAFKTHRAVLVEHGQLTHHPGRFLGLFPNDRYVPDEIARERLVNELRQAAREEVPLDNRLALLAALVHASGLVHKLSFDKSERAKLKTISKGEDLGGAVEASVAAANAAIFAGAGAAGVVAGGS